MDQNTNSEPTYEYVKGVGWVLSLKPPCPTRSEVFGNYRLTLMEREPEIGEFYFSENKNMTIGKVMDNIRGGWVAGRLRQGRTDFNVWTGKSMWNTGKYFAFTVDPV